MKAYKFQITFIILNISVIFHSVLMILIEKYSMINKKKFEDLNLTQKKRPWLQAPTLLFNHENEIFSFLTKIQYKHSKTTAHDIAEFRKKTKRDTKRICERAKNLPWSVATIVFYAAVDLTMHSAVLPTDWSQSHDVFAFLSTFFLFIFFSNCLFLLSWQTLIPSHGNYNRCEQ